MSTHFLEEIIHCHRVLVLDAGRIVMEGTPNKILQQVERLKGCSLEVPPIHQLIYELRHRGVDLSPSIMGVEDMVKALCRLL